LPVTQTVTVNQPVTPTFAQVAAICSGGTFTLPTTSINGIPGSWLPAINNTATTTYTFTPSAGQCALPVTQTVTVNQPVTPTFAQVAAICSGGTFTLPTTSINGILGSWLPAINNTATTTYTFTPSAGQCALPVTQTVTVNQPVTPTFSADIIYGCAPLTVNFTNTTPNSINCIWTIGDGTILTGISNVTNVFSSEGCFDVTLSSSGSDGCISMFMESNLVCVEVSPVADFFTDNTILTQDDLDINFINTSTGAVDYIWNFGDNSALNTEENPYHEYFFTESAYTIMLIATSSLGCIDTAYSSITMAEQLLYFIPNTFTPDGDLKNNSFQPVFTSGFDPYNFNMLIFNRWGEILFETNNAAIGWDGTYNGDYVQDGVYTWKIEFKAKENDKKHFLSGHVNLFR
jgi:gliding motility-associated-like protein